jgi:hypothetical protein
MSVSSTECQCFEHIAEYQVAVYKECRHAVIPSHFKSYLQRVHRVKDKQAEDIAEQVYSWLGLIEYASELQMPS